MAKTLFKTKHKASLLLAGVFSNPLELPFNTREINRRNFALSDLEIRDFHSPANVYYDLDKNTIELNTTLSGGQRKRGQGGNVDIYWDDARRIRIVAAMSVIGQVLQIFGGDVRNQVLNMGVSLMQRLEHDDPPPPDQQGQPGQHHTFFADYVQGPLHDPNRQIVGINTYFLGDEPLPALNSIDDFIRSNPNLNPVRHGPVDYEEPGAYGRARAPGTRVIPPPDATAPDMPAPAPQPSANPKMKERRQPNVQGTEDHDKLDKRNPNGKFCDAPIGHPWNLLLGLNPGDVTDSAGFNIC